MPFALLALALAVGSVLLYSQRAWAHHEPGLAVLESAQRALARGVRETNTNTGPVVDVYLRAVGIAPPANWCAAAVTAWMREGFDAVGLKPPIKGGAQAKGFITQFERIGKWTPKTALKPDAISPGSIVVWSRGDPKSWTGHIGVVESMRGNTLVTIEGNSGPKGDRVARMERALDDVRLLGIGRFA